MTDAAASSDYKFNFRQQVFAQLEMQARRALYLKRPDIWARDVVGMTMWSKQKDVAYSVVENHNTMVAAGHGVGKSKIAAAIACWWVDTHEIGQARVLTTAPTTSQVKSAIWREMQMLHKESRKRHAEYLLLQKEGKSTQGLPDHSLPGYITSQATWMSNDRIELGLGRTPPRGREGDAFQGTHGGVLAILDEAVGVNAEMIDTLRNNTTSDEDRILMLANPTNPNSVMGQIWNDPLRSSDWCRITISVLESPHFTDEGKDLPEDVMKHMTNKKFVEGKKLEYGEDSANYKARVKGEWALEAGMILFPDEVLQAGLDTVVIPDNDDPVHIGFDVARSEKGDYSYLYTKQEGWVYKTQEWREGEEGWNSYPLATPIKTDRRGLKLRYLDRWRGLPFFPIHNENGQRSSDIAANEKVHAHMKEIGAEQLRIDADGMGALMYDAMLDVTDGSYEIIRMMSNDSSPDRNAWYNQRAYQYSELARRMRLGEVDIEPDGDEHPLVKQLGAIEYKFASGFAESILILSKKEMKSKGIKSPDAADAAWYAAALIDLGDGNKPGDKFSYDLDEFVGTSNGFYDYSW